MTPSRFSDQLLNDVRAHTDLFALISRDVGLRQVSTGRFVGLCPFHTERTPSFRVNARTGKARCFGCGWHGDAIDYVQAREGLSFVEAVKRLAIDAGLMNDQSGLRRPRKSPVARQTDHDREAERERSVQWARDLWGKAEPAAGTIVETYLRSRGITLSPPASIRFLGSTRHSETGRYLPAMVAAVQDDQRRIVGVHRTFLRPDGNAKADVRPAKKMGGACFGGAVRFARPARVLRLAEGIETALSVLQVLPDQAVWAALSIGNFASIALPPDVRELRLFADADNKDPAAADTALRRAAENHRRNGVTVYVAYAPDHQDFNDVIRSGGDHVSPP